MRCLLALSMLCGTSFVKKIAKMIAKTNVTKMRDAVLKYDSQVPRYTSYPTAPHFTSTIDDKIYTSHLQALNSHETLSLYLHIPFCKQMCWYCGCYTKATLRYAPVEDYAQILMREINLVGDLLKQKNHKTTHIHFGGGSPTILQPEAFEQIMQTIKSKFNIAADAEIAIEVDPRNVDEEKIIAYKKMGINRVSIGVQDFNDEVQKAINREQSFDLVYDCIKIFRKYGIENINLDLIYGLPKQSVEMVKKNIDLAMLLKPTRIALFSYAHVLWKKKHMRLIREEDLPDNASRLLMYDEARKKLQQENFFAIGLDHFAKADDSMFQAFQSKVLKRNFQGYSTDSANNIIGFGASAISYLGDCYAQNILDLDEYKKIILSNKLPIAKGVEIGKEDKMRKKIIDELMCYLEVDLQKICDEFGVAKNYFTSEIAALQELVADGLVTVDGLQISINKNAPQICRVVASKFDQFFVASLKQHSKIA